MNRNDFIQEIFKLTPGEEKRKLHPTSQPSKFYDILEKKGMKDKNGYYFLPDTLQEYSAGKPLNNINERINQSIFHNTFGLKKASRFSREPFGYADALCIRYVYSGTDEIITPDTSFILHQNDIFLLNAHFVSSHYLAHENDIVFTLLFKKEYLMQNILKRNNNHNVVIRFIYNYILGSQNPKNYIIFHGDDNDKIPRLFEDLVKEYAYPAENSISLLEFYIHILFIEMSRCTYDYDLNMESRKSILTASLLYDIETDPKEISLNKLADKYGYHPDYISRQIRLATGLSFKDYVLELKMSQVIKLLKNSTLPISEIMHESGFYNETYFYKKFKQIYGQSPNQYRKTMYDPT